MRWLSKYFINGLIVIVPLAITTLVIVQFFSFTEDLLGRHLPIQFPGLGLVTAFLIILLSGWLSTLWITKKLIAISERLLGAIPIIKFIYNSVKQISTAVFESHQYFKEAVLVPYPHPGVKALGFVMSELSPSISSKLSEEHVCVFVPMSLNMTAGFNIIVKKRDIIPLDVTGESALQYVITAGAIMPRNNGMTKS